jgi:hypothetical protein
MPPLRLQINYVSKSLVVRLAVLSGIYLKLTLWEKGEDDYYEKLLEESVKCNMRVKI